MGIDGLLPQLEDIMVPVDIWRLLPGKSVGVDSFGWLHALAIHAAEDLTADEPKYDRVVQGFVGRAQKLQARGIDATFVFDGKPVPVKAETAEARMESRAKKLVEAAELDGEDRQRALQAAVSITAGLVGAVVAALRLAGMR